MLYFQYCFNIQLFFLFKYLKPSGQQKVYSPVLPFEESMLISSIRNGCINFNEFLTGLYENKILSKKINEY